MKRCLFNVFAVLSLLLCAATCLLWARSIWRSRDYDFVHLTTSDPRSDAAVREGIVWLNLSSRLTRTEAPDLHKSVWGFSYNRRTQNGTRYWLVQAPCWVFAVSTALVSACWAALGWRQRRRLQKGRCCHCGYDLRATPERCPECGNVPTPQVETA